MRGTDLWLRDLWGQGCLSGLSETMVHLICLASAEASEVTAPPPHPLVQHSSSCCKTQKRQKKTDLEPQNTGTTEASLRNSNRISSLSSLKPFQGPSLSSDKIPASSFSYFSISPHPFTATGPLYMLFPLPE